MRRSLCLVLLLAFAAIANAGGGEIFNARCAVCHQADATGIPGLYPPLADSIGYDVRIPQGRIYLVHVVSSGLSGAISVHGARYEGYMQAWPTLSDDEVAQVLDYVLLRFNSKVIPKDFSPLTAGEVRKDRAAGSAMSTTHKEREALMKALRSVGALGGAAPSS